MFTMDNYRAIKNGTTCVSCIYYDGLVCTKDDEYKSVSDYCEEWKEEGDDEE